MRVLGIDVRWSDAPAEFPPPSTASADTPRKMWLRTQDAYTGLPEFGLIADPKFLNIVLVLALTLLAIVRINRMETPLPRPFRRLRPPRLLLRRSPRLLRPTRRLPWGVFRRRLSSGSYQTQRAVDFSNARSALDVALASMIGLREIKAHITQLLDTLEMDERRRAARGSFTTQRGCMHMVFMGSPGTGKTAAALLVADTLRRLGVLRRGHLVIGKKADLLGRYSNHVARNTRAVVRSALGGVLMIDEAYSLLQGEAELGRECVNVLVDMCYAHKDELVVILAGYTDMMADFLGANAGLDSRFPHKFSFSDYSVEELEEIAALMVGKAAFELADDGARDALRRMVAAIPHETPCGNARSVENRISAAIAAQSTRLSAEEDVATGGRLFQLTAADFDAAAAAAERAAKATAVGE